MQKTETIAIKNIYWLSCYMEMALLTARLLKVQLSQLSEDSSQKLSVSWEWVFKTLKIQVPVGQLLQENSSESSDFCQADAYTLMDHLTFETDVPYSIVSYFQKAREKVSTDKSDIGKILYKQLEKFSYLESVKATDIWPDKVQEFYEKIINDVYLFYSLSNNFLYRDRMWYFLQLGKRVCQLEYISSLLENYIKFVMGYKGSKQELIGLLSCSGGLDLCQQRYPMDKIQLSDVVDFLMRDSKAPCSLYFFIEQIEKDIQRVDPKTTEPPFNETIALLHSVKTALVDSPFSLTQFLEWIHEQSNKIHKSIVNNYFTASLSEGEEK